MGAALKRRQRSRSFALACASPESSQNRFKLLNHYRIKDHQLQQKFQILYDYNPAQSSLSSRNIRKGNSHQLCHHSFGTLRADVGSNRCPLESSARTEKTLDCDQKRRR
jgi:hypothetical protein